MNCFLGVARPRVVARNGNSRAFSVRFAFLPSQATRRRADDRVIMEGISLNNVNGSAPATLDHGPLPRAARAVSQDEASALALLVALPVAQLATAGVLGTQLDAWA